MKCKFYYLFVALLMTMSDVCAQDVIPAGAKNINELFDNREDKELFINGKDESDNKRVYYCEENLHAYCHVTGGTQTDPIEIYVKGEVSCTDSERGDRAVFDIVSGYVEFIGINDGVNDGKLLNSRSNTINCSNTKDSQYSAQIGNVNITIRNLIVDRNTGNNTKNTLFFGSHNGYTATYTLNNVTVRNFEGGNNSETNGAVAINSKNATCIFNNCTFQDNNVSSNNKTCGGVYVNAGTATFNTCTFTNNRGSYGSALRIGANGHITMNNCTVEDNTGYNNAYKGAVFLASGGSLTLGGTTTITTQTLGGNIYLATGATFTPNSNWTGEAGVTVENKPVAATPTRQITTKNSPEVRTITSDNNNLLVDYVTTGANTPYHQLSVPTIGQDANNNDMINYLKGHTNVSVNLARTIQTGGYNTLCLPFNVSNSQLKAKFGKNVILKSLESSTLDNDVLTLNLEDATSIEAGKPYLISVSANTSLTPGFDNVSWIDYTGDDPELTTKETTYCNFVPVYNPTHLENGNKNILFLMGNNRLTFPDASKYTADMRGLRAYFVLKGDAMRARTFVLPFDDQTTAILSLPQDSNELDANAPMYDLLGQQVDGNYRGIVIQNGKKFVNR